MKKMFTILWVLLACSCSNPEAGLNEVSPDFYFSSTTHDIHSGMRILMTNASSNYTDISWHIDDQLVGQDEILAYVFKTIGVHEIRLKACNGNQCDEVIKKITVKRSIQDLLAGTTSKTWKLLDWKNALGESQDFDACSTCPYAQTFYTFNANERQGRHVWLNNGTLNCGEDNVQCKSYGPNGHGFYYFNIDLSNQRKFIFIGEGSMAAYQFSIDDNYLVMRLVMTGEILVYEPM